VFGAVKPPRRQSLNGKEEGKSATIDRKDRETDDAIECANKVVLKKQAVRRVVDVDLPRSHSDSKKSLGRLPWCFICAAFADENVAHQHTGSGSGY